MSLKKTGELKEKKTQSKSNALVAPCWICTRVPKMSLKKTGELKEKKTQLKLIIVSLEAPYWICTRLKILS